MRKEKSSISDQNAVDLTLLCIEISSLVMSILALLISGYAYFFK